MKKVIAIFLIIALGTAVVFAQTKQTETKKTLQCTAPTNAGNEPMTYLVGAGKLSREEKKRIKEKWGVLIIPKGETERAKEIRANAVGYRQYQINILEESMQLWRKLHPNATAEEIKRRQEIQDVALENVLKTKLIKERIAMKSWDWREHGINVQPVMNQGVGCNTCWAFAATSAAAASLQKSYWDRANTAYFSVEQETGELIGITGGIMFWEGDPSPFVQDLLNCMPIKAEEICSSGWHGAAFDFMVYKQGIPMAYEDRFKREETDGSFKLFRRIYSPGRKYQCSPNNGFAKAIAWDYVNSPPDLLPTVEQLKTALIEHGPLAAPIRYDKCLENYKGGVFNEMNLGTINHVVLLVGWDDSRQAWLIKNSWGEEWGEKGFAWIKYGSNNIGMFAAWIEGDKSSFFGAPRQN